MPANFKRRSCPYDLRKRVLINNFLKTQMSTETENVHPKQDVSSKKEDWTSQPQSTMQKVLRSLSCRLRSPCSRSVQHVKTEVGRHSFAVFGSWKSESQESLLIRSLGRETNKIERRVSTRSITSKLSVSNLRASWKQQYKPITPSPQKTSVSWTRNKHLRSNDNVRKVSKNASPIRHSKRSLKKPSIRRALENFVSTSSPADIVTYPPSVEQTTTPKASFITKLFRTFSFKENAPGRRTAVNRSSSVHASPSRPPLAPRLPRRAHSMRLSMTRFR